MSAQQVAEKAVKFGMKEVDVRVKGPGSGRESAITALQSAGLKIKSIEDATPLPHNGCRPEEAPESVNWRMESGENYRGDAAARKFFSSLRLGGEPLTPTPDP